MQPNKAQLIAYDFFCAHKVTIERLRKEVHGLLVYFKTQRIIKSFSNETETLIPNLNVIKFSTTLDTGSKYLPSLACSLMVYVEHIPKGQELIKMQLKKGEKNIRLILPSHFSYEAYGTPLYEEITRQSFGIECEMEFLEKFLFRLKEKREEIVYVQHTSTKQDMEEGVDFTIGYKPKELDNTFPVSFQLKSSKRFLEKHKRRYPHIGVYVFQPKFLGNRGKLERDFFEFLAQQLASTS